MKKRTAMRKNLIVALMITAVYLLTACNKEEVIYYSALGIIRISEDSVVIETDNGNRLLVDDRNRIGIPLVDNDRVIAYFTLVDKTAPAGIDLVIDIYDISKVLYKPVIELTSAIADSIGDDPLTVGSLWLDKDFISATICLLRQVTRLCASISLATDLRNITCQYTELLL